MNPLHLTRTKLASDVIDNMVARALFYILGRCKPTRVVLFGSAAAGTMTDQSDIDLIITFASEEARQVALKTPKPRGELGDVALDILWLTDEEFQRKRVIGGVCMIAAEDGIQIYPRHAEEDL